LLKLKILLADDHSVLRAGLKLLLNSEDDFMVVGEAADGEEALQLIETIPADILLLDLSMPKMNGLECLREIKKRKLQHRIKILVLTMYQDEQCIKEAMQLGAFGYLEKNSLDTELFQALRTIATGNRYLRPKDKQVLLESFLNTSESNGSNKQQLFLSVREKEVLELLVRGHSMSCIADILYISVKTVSTYKTRLMDKLNCTKKSELVEYALRNNLLSPDKNQAPL
jgi:two-component system, NarL family, response regulator NreC